MKTWRVVPISEYQKLDVREEDLLNEGHFRKCETYRGGGGYDRFPAICERRLGIRAHEQFIVQLYGCNLDCPYCYVTRSGVHGAYIEYSTDALMMAFLESGQQVFHLMGGAPALYLDMWPDLLDQLSKQYVFHSDFLLSENVYKPSVLRRIAHHSNTLFALNIKGVNDIDYVRNTRKQPKHDLMIRNLDALVDAGVNFYITFTNPDQSNYESYCTSLDLRYPGILNDSFVIPLIEYNATPYVDK